MSKCTWMYWVSLLPGSTRSLGLEPISLHRKLFFICKRFRYAKPFRLSKKKNFENEKIFWPQSRSVAERNQNASHDVSPPHFETFIFVLKSLFFFFKTVLSVWLSSLCLRNNKTRNNRQIWLSLYFFSPSWRLFFFFIFPVCSGLLSKLSRLFLLVVSYYSLENTIFIQTIKQYFHVTVRLCLYWSVLFLWVFSYKMWQMIIIFISCLFWT